MGTFGDWGHIVAMAVFLGLYEWARDAGRQPYAKLGISLAGWFLVTIALGIWFSFHSRAFRVPLIFITVPVGAGGAILQYFARARRGV